MQHPDFLEKGSDIFDNRFHDDEIGNVSFTFDGDINLTSFQRIIGKLIETEGARMYRYKGLCQPLLPPVSLVPRTYTSFFVWLRVFACLPHHAYTPQTHTVSLPHILTVCRALHVVLLCCLGVLSVAGMDKKFLFQGV